MARLCAALVDGVLAVLIVIVAAMRAAGGTAGSNGIALPALALALAALVLFALRDVASGASLAKWLLGLRVETGSGRRPGLGSRLARAPWSVLPLGWASPALEARTPWRVVAYTPSTAGLVARLALAVAALAVGGATTFAALRPGIGRDDALRLAESTIAADPLLQRVLGQPITLQLGRIAPRRAVRGAAVFTLQATGPRGSQSMTVVARRVGDAWAVEEITDIETVMSADAPSGSGALVHRDPP
jgi:hypothetical protein